jgi:periplasmic protein CpxP/Spy
LGCGIRKTLHSLNKVFASAAVVVRLNTQEIESIFSLSRNQRRRDVAAILKAKMKLEGEKMKLNWKRTSVIATGVGALIVAFAMLVVSQGPPGPRDGRGGPGGRDGLGPLARDLNLTDEQKSQIKKIKDSFDASTNDWRQQLRTLHENESDPLTGNFDEASVRANAEARAKVEVELTVSRARMMSQIAAVLTPDQKAQLTAKRQQFQRRPPPPPDNQ